MKRYFKAVLPTPAQWVAFLILPTIFTIYFWVSRYSNQFIQTQGIDYVAVQDNVLAQLYITGSLADFFTRFMDFAFWGVLASIGVVIAWSFSATKTSLENHSTQAGFTNFNTDKKTWHQQLIVAASIKILLVVVMFYCFLQFISGAVPKLATGVAQLVAGFSSQGIKTVLAALVTMIVLQALFTSAIRMFKIVQTD